MVRHVERLLAAAAIDDRRRSHDLRTRSARDIDGFARRPARRHHVLDHEDALAGREREPAAQRQRAVLPFGEDGAHPQRASDLLADDNPAEGWRQHGLDAETPYTVGDGSAAQFRVTRVLEDERTLQVPGAVEAGGEPEMAFEQGADAAEGIENGISSYGHRRRVYLLHLDEHPVTGRRLDCLYTFNLEFGEMRTKFSYGCLLVSALAVFGTAMSVSAQRLPGLPEPLVVPSGLLPAAQQAPVPAQQVRRLSVDEAVKLAAENNLGIQISRYEPQIQDLAVLQARSVYTPSVTNDFQSVNRTQPNQNFLAGALTTNEDQFANTTGLAAQTRWGGNYQVGLNNFRSESNNFSATRNPVLQSRITATVNQPLLRDFKIDSFRQQLQVAVKNREIADFDLREQLAATSRAVRNAYWNLAYQIASLDVARQSLELARESLRNTRSRVEIGTIPPIDIIADEAEVAQREEAVIVAEAQIATSEDTLRALVFNPSSPDFWSIRIQPEQLPEFQPAPVNLNTAIQRALERRTDLARVRKNIEITDVNIAFARNQTLPDISANLTYNAIGIGGREIERGVGPFGPGTGEPTGGFVYRGLGSVLGDLFQYDYPTWTLALNVNYPIGRSQQEAALARARLQRTQATTQLRNAQLQVETEVRQRARVVQTNQQRVQSLRASRELMERRLDAEQRKFAAGTSTNFFVFQAQRDLALARNNELRAILDYNQSVVDLETAQEVPLR